MMSIPFLSPAPVPAGAPGAPASTNAVGVDFAALLPGAGMPRQGDAEGGKDLPADDADEIGVGATAAAAWVTPPLWPAVCPAAAKAKGSIPPSATVFPGEGRGPGSVLSLMNAPVAPLVQPVRAAAVAGEGVSLQPVQDEAAALDPAKTPQLDPGVRRGTGVVPVPPVDDPQAIAGAIAGAAPVANATVAPMTPLFPGEGRGPVTASSVVPTPLAPDVQPIRTDNAPIAAVPQLGPGLRRGTEKAGVVAISAPVTAEKSVTSSEKPITDPATQAKVAAPVVRTAELQPLTPTRIAPASQMFAAAIQRAVRDERSPAANDTIAGLAAPVGTTQTAAIGTPAPSLDMTRETWPVKMIAHIEALRDAVDAADTSIRLVPDKLGAIDVSLKQEGDTVQVQLNAHQPETRQLLAEAQPKLAEMAEAKGLRLTTHTGDGSAGGQPQPQPQPQPRAAAPAPTPRRAAADQATSADEDRIA